MKKFSATWVLAALFAALLAFLLIAKPRSRDAVKEEALTLASDDREAIDRITVENGNGSFVLEKRDGGWRLGSPRDLPVEETALNQMINALSGLVAADAVWESAGPAERERAGLEKPAATVTWRAGGKESRLEIGGELPRKDTRYVAASSKPGVFTARSWSVEIFTKGLEDFRRKKLIDVPRDEVRTILLEVPGREPLMLARKDAVSPWIASTPFTGRADRGKANGLLTRLSNLRASEFLDAVPAEAPLEGLRGSISLTATGGRSWTVLVGAERKEGDRVRFLARDGDHGQVILTEGPLPEDLAAKPAEWRDKQLFDFFVDDVSSLELTLEKGPLSVERNADGMFATKGESPVVVNPEATGLLRAARDATVRDFGPDAPDGSAKATELGLEKPVLRATWTSKDGPAELVVGRTKPGTTLRWVRTHESPSALLVDAEPLVKAAAELAAAPARPSPSPSPTPAPATPAEKG